MQQWLNWRAVRHFQIEVMLQRWRDACFKGMSLSLSLCPDLLSTELCLCSPSAQPLKHFSLFPFLPSSHNYVFQLSRAITFPLCWFASAAEFPLLLSLQAWIKAHWKQLKFSYRLLEDIAERRETLRITKLNCSFLSVHLGWVKRLSVSNSL